MADEIIYPDDYALRSIRLPTAGRQKVVGFPTLWDGPVKLVLVHCEKFGKNKVKIKLGKVFIEHDKDIALLHVDAIDNYKIGITMGTFDSKTHRYVLAGEFIEQTPEGDPLQTSTWELELGDKLKGSMDQKVAMQANAWGTKYKIVQAGVLVWCSEWK